MKDIFKFIIKCLLAPILLIFGMGIAGKLLGFNFSDSNTSDE